MTHPTPPPTPLGSAIGFAGSAKEQDGARIEIGITQATATGLWHACAHCVGVKDKETARVMALVLADDLSNQKALRSAAEKALAAYDSDDFLPDAMDAYHDAMEYLRTALNGQSKTKL